MDKSIMNNLLEKYLDNRLTASEFIEFQRYINASSDEELGLLIGKAWKEEKGGAADIRDIRNLKQTIDNTNRRERSINRYTVRKILHVAAVISLPIMLAVGYLLLSTTRNENVMAVNVSRGNKADMELPDGTIVHLNAETSLSYNASSFNRKERTISFSGEGYFEVAKNAKKPFIIIGNGIEVEVLGTTFNLKIRDEYKSVELDLIEGKVSLTSSLTSEEVTITPHQKAILDKKSGRIEIVKADPSLSSAWMRGELVFHGATLQEVFGEIERNYGVVINENFADSTKNDLFTGTFKLQNLDETMRILRMHYHFEYSIEGLEVTVLKSDKGKKL